jgi:hypothetical protein
VSLITPLMNNRPDRASSATAAPPPTERRPCLASAPSPPDPAAPAQRLRAATWINGRSALGVCLVLAAVLAGALFLDRAQRLVPVYAGSSWTPAGLPPGHRWGQNVPIACIA